MSLYYFIYTQQCQMLKWKCANYGIDNERFNSGRVPMRFRGRKMGSEGR